MSSPAVFVKATDTNLPITVNVALAAGDSVTGVSLVSVSPVTPTPLVVGALAFTASSVSATLNGGVDSVSYGVRLSVTTAFGNTIDQVLAVMVHTNLQVPYASKNPYSYQSLVDEVSAGDASVGRGFFVLPVGASTAGFYVTWSLMDSNGRIFSSGNCYDFSTTLNSFSTVIEANAVIHVPSSVPPTLHGEKYQLRWELRAPGQDDQYSFESIRVVSLADVPVGVHDAVELVGDVSTVTLVTEKLFDTVGFELFSPVGNSKLLNFTQLNPPVRVATGWLYTGYVNTAGLAASTSPYVLSWKYWNSQTPQQSFRETARIFVINSSILNAIEDMRMMVNKAKATLFQFADMIFDTTTLMGFLRRGMDMFNGAGGVFTTFDMTDATGGIRDYWIGYSEVAVLQAQALAEGEKAFDFQGQAISLTVERSQFYQQAADALLARLENAVRTYKQNLLTKGISGGTGNTVNGAGLGNIPKLGITLSPASQFGRFHSLFRLP